VTGIRSSTNAVTRLMIELAFVFRGTSCVAAAQELHTAARCLLGAVATPLSFVFCLQAGCQHLLGTPEAASSASRYWWGGQGCVVHEPPLILIVRPSLCASEPLPHPIIRFNTPLRALHVCHVCGCIVHQQRRACNLFCWTVMVCRPRRHACAVCWSLHLPVQPDITAVVSVAA
jgi:hypothetical protein